MPQQVAIGSTIYLHRPNRPFKVEEFHLLISAHGLAIPGAFTTPAWANLHFYGKHGAAIKDPGFREIIEGKYQVLESVGSLESCPQYLLSKYQGRWGSRTETHEALQRTVQNNSSWLATVSELIESRDEKKMRIGRRHASRNFAFHFDVLTIRSRWHHKLGITLASALSQLGSAGYRYEQIHCSFCRYKLFGGSVRAGKWGAS